MIISVSKIVVKIKDLIYNLNFNFGAPVAQLDRAGDSGSLCEGSNPFGGAIIEEISHFEERPCKKNQMDVSSDYISSRSIYLYLINHDIIFCWGEICPFWTYSCRGLFLVVLRAF